MEVRKRKISAELENPISGELDCRQVIDDSCLRLPLLLVPVVYLADPFHDDSTGRRFLGNVDVLHAVIFFVLS